MRSHFQGQTQLTPAAASCLESWSQPQLLPQIPSGYKSRWQNRKARIEERAFSGALHSKVTFLTYETLIIMATRRKKQTQQRAATVPSPLPSPAHLFCARATEAVAAPGNLKALSCTHNFGGAFLKCSRSLKGKRRCAARENLDKNKKPPFYFYPL